jgi:hypothetical protein
MMRVLVALGLTLSLLLPLGGCAHDVQARLPAAPEATAATPTGTITILFSSPADDVAIAINGALVTSGAHTERVTVSGVPEGFAEVFVTTGASERQLRGWVDAGRETTIPVAAQRGGGLGSTLAGALIQLALLVAYAHLR